MFGNREKNINNLESIVDEIKKDFVYTRDHKWFDAWTVMCRQKDGKFYGDCEDFALTVIWHLCNRNIFLFLFNFLVINRFNIWLGRGGNELHAIGSAYGKFFDNIAPIVTSRAGMRSFGVTTWFPLVTPFAWLMLLPKLLFGLIKKIALKR